MLYRIRVLLTCLVIGLFNTDALTQENQPPQFDIAPSENHQQQATTPSQSTLGLNREETNWLAKHPVIDFFIDSDSPPYQFRRNDKPIGITVDLLEVIEQQLGIRFLKSSLPSDTLAKDVMSGNVSMFGIWPEQSFMEDTPYLKTNTIVKGYLSLFGRENDQVSNNINEIKNHKIGIVKGFNEKIITKLGKYNEIITIDKAERIGALLSKQIDLYLIYREVGRFGLKQNMTRGIEEKYTFPETHNGVIYIHKSEPLLWSIINKVIGDISDKELPRILEKWYGVETLPTSTEVSETNQADEWKKVVAAGLILILTISVTLILFRLLIISKKDPLAYEFASLGGKKLAVMLNSVLVVIACFLAFWALNNVREKVEDDIRNSLQTVVKTTMEAMNIWINDQKNKLNSIASDKRIIELTLQQLTHFKHNNDLSVTPALNELRGIFSEIKSHTKHEGFFIIAPDGTSIGSMRDTNLGQVNLIQNQRPELLRRVFLGETIFIPPIVSDISAPNAINVSGYASPPTMFFASPIKNNDGEVIAVLTERFNPHGDFSRINSLGRIGQTGETYSFDKQGRLLSESRFLKSLVEAGLIPNDGQSILSIELRNPGGNLLAGFKNNSPIKDRPLTLMAESAIKGKSAYNIKGYRDYRGIPVFGAWIWEDKLGFGMTSEVDANEAMEAYYSARVTVIAVLVVMVLVSISLTLLSMVLGSRANKALQLARDQLEERVLLRTKELRHSEERFDLAMRGANDGLWDWNYLTGEVYYSKRWKGMLGYGQEELEGTLDTWRNLIHPDDNQKTLKLVEACVNGGQDDFNLEFRMRHKNGHWVPILSRAYVVRDTVKHMPVRFVGTHIDLTQQKQAEQELQVLLTDLNEQRYVLDQHAIVAVTDLQGTITYANQRFAEISGYSVDELIGQNHRILNSQTHNQEFWRDMYRTVATGGVWNDEICNRAKGGHLYWVDTTISAFTGENRKPRAYVAIRTDITQRKFYENELQEAKYIAEGANKAKSEFLASMSHEIRTPMNGVLGMLGLLLNNELTAEQYQRVLIAQNSAKSLLSIINDILDFSKVEAGKLELEDLDFDVRKLFEEIAKTMSFRADEKNIELLLDVSGVEHSMIISDPSRIRQIVTNLIGNAIKFTEHGEVIITAYLKAYDDEYLKLVCSVRDTGIGIPATLMPELFKSFTQVDTSTTRKYGGSGLGLSICKNLCELMNGSIEASSEPGNGSCFKFEVLVRPSKKTVKVVPSVDISQLKILVVDDNKTNRDIFRNQLEHWGASVVEAENAHAAISQCKSHAENLFDIALIDMNMPEIDGISLAKTIRHDSQLGTMKLIMMTSSFEQESSEKLSDIGLSGYFSKPVSTSDLFDALALVSCERAQENTNIFITKNYLETLDRKQQSPVKSDIPKWLPGTRILLVEDNQINQLVVQGMLKEWSLNCDLANNGLEAISFLKNAPDDAPYTLVLMDCQMPELDGYAATRMIREGKSGDRYSKTPIIAITANAMKGDKEKCLNAGMNDFLTKPLESTILLSMLKQWMPSTPPDSPVRVDTVTKKNLSDGNNTQHNQARTAPLKIPLNLYTIDFSYKKPDIVNSPATYLKALSLYVKQAQLFLDKFSALAQANESKQVKSQLHSIKGTSGNLGMHSVYEQAATLEKNIIDKTTVDPELVGTFCDLVKKSVVDAEVIIEANIQNELAMNNRDYPEIKSDLIEHLKENNLVPESLILEYKSYSRNMDKQKLTQAVIEAIDAFDYDIALGILLSQDH